MVNSLSSTAIASGYSDLTKCSEYKTQYSRWQQRQQVFGDIDFKSNLFMSGVDGDDVLQKIENYVEGGRGDGIDGNTLSWDRYICDSNNLNNVLFQSESGGTYTNMRFDKGYYTQMSEQDFAAKQGFANKAYDTVLFGQDSAQFIDFKFSGYEDGQTYTPIDLSQFSNVTWGRNASFVSKEIDLSIVNGLDSADDAETDIANYTFSQIQATESQWMTDSIRQALSQYKEGTQAYLNAYKSYAQLALDQELYSGGSTWWNS